MNIIYLGVNYFAAEILSILIAKKKNIVSVITRTDTMFGRGLKIKCQPVKDIALLNNIKVYTISTVNDVSAKRLIKSLKPDIIIVVEYGEKISRDIIEMSRNGIINLHPSILPDLRGPTPIEYTIINGYISTGVSVIKINDNLDEGSILGFKLCHLKKKETFASLSLKLQRIGSIVLIRTLRKINTNNEKLKVQSQDQVTNSRKLVKSFFKINWNNNAIFINKAIRATTLKKHCTQISNYIINVIETSVIHCTMVYEPGIIIEISKLGIYVATGYNILKLKKIQFLGKKILDVTDVLKAKTHIFFVGNKFF